MSVDRVTRIVEDSGPDWVRDEPGFANDRNRQRPQVDLEVFGINRVDWSELWSCEPVGEDWCMEPVIPRGRQVTIFAAAGVGKSEFLLAGAAAKSTGRSVFGQVAQAPTSVVYIDQEMTDEDLRERLSDMGYGPDDDLSYLHYFQLQAFPPLDTIEGGDVLMAVVERYAPELVCLDTMSRVVQGDENSADTYRDFYRCSGCRLKAAGVSLVRLDHSGKDKAKGQRGSSAKNDDVDLVWEMYRDQDRVILKRGKSRVNYVPAEASFVREDSPVRYVIAPTGWPSGTAEVAGLLDSLNVDIDATSAVAQTALTKNGTGRRKTVVLAALKYRKHGSQISGTDFSRSQEPSQELQHKKDKKMQVDHLHSVPGTVREPSEPEHLSTGTLGSPYKGEPSPRPTGTDDSPQLSDDYLATFPEYEDES